MQEGLLNIVETIINLGFNFEFSNDRGLYPLHIATRHGHVEIVRYKLVVIYIYVYSIVINGFL